jgi:hypothetical protein
MTDTTGQEIDDTHEKKSFSFLLKEKREFLREGFTKMVCISQKTMKMYITILSSLNCILILNYSST